MYLRVENNENYCHLLNITKAIIHATSTIDYYNLKIECKYQNRFDFCNNISELFSSIYVIPTSNNIKIVNILHQAIDNTLDCKSNKVNNIKILHFNYELIPLLLIGFIVGYMILVKNKIKFKFS